MRHPKMVLLAAMVVVLPLLVGFVPSPSSAETVTGPLAFAQRDDADWYEAYIPTADPTTTLHADILRPTDAALDGEQQPVILTVSPYTGHSGATTDYAPLNEGPSDRFFDFLDLSGALEQGYTYVMVDLPGQGGSSGCYDWGGPREQQATADAVEWAASQPWSSGRVALLGKSYDAWTGLMGMAQQPQGLAAVVSLEPVYAGYRYYYDDGVRFANSVATAAFFTGGDLRPGTFSDTPEYHVNSAPQGYCYAENHGLSQDDDPEGPYWAPRDLLRDTEEIDTPLLLTQGFLERNTKPDGAFDYWNGLGGTQTAGTRNRAWFGQFDHVRPWEREGGELDEGRFHAGRGDFVAQMMDFLDHHLKGTPAASHPVVEVQDNRGRWRAEQAWPPADAQMFSADLQPGTYTDDNSNRGLGDSAGNGIWTISQALRDEVHLAGEPLLLVDVETTLPRANLVGNVYDLAPDGSAHLVSRGTVMVRDPGSQTIAFELYGQDWVFEAGHRIAVLVSGANAEWWVHVPTQQEVTVAGGHVDLPLLTIPRTEFTHEDASTPRLESHLRSTITISEQDVAQAETHFELPAHD